jgi:polysaccharide export outer membrane protein
MNLKILLIAGVLSTALLCEGQDQKPATPAPATAASSAPAGSQPAAPANATTSSQAPVSLAAGKLADSYVIGPNDELAINTWKEPAFSGLFTVRPDGMITVPLVGDILAAGFTPADLGGQIMVKLRKYLQDPVVTITVAAIKSKMIYIMGEGAMKKGPMEMTPGMTVLQAIAIAGTSEDSNLKKAYMLRDTNGVRTKVQIHYKQALKGDPQYDFALKPGDTIVIP